MIALACSLRRKLPLALLLTSLSPRAAAAPWQPDPNRALPDDGSGVAQKVELVDIDADGFVDLVFANSRGDAFGGDADAQVNALYHNDAGLGFSLVPGVFAEPDNAYVIKAGDLDGDGDLELVVGVCFSGSSYVLLNTDGFLSRHEMPLGDSIGDLELGDLDGDGILDLVAADWGVTQPFGDVGDPGGPLRLWLGDGLGEFEDGSLLLPGGMDTHLSWSFDIELLDFDNDFDLDILAASRGPGPALALRNTGTHFVVHPIPALAGKPVNSGFTVLDLDIDGALDLVTLQDGFGGGRDTVLVGDGGGNFVDNPGAYWAFVDNPKRLDFDAASLDFDNDGTPDIIVVGPQQSLGEVNARLMRNDGSSLVPLAPDGAAFPVTPELAASFGVQIADFDLDRRPDVAVAVRHAEAPDVVLFGGPDVPEDSTPPRIDAHDLVPDPLLVGQQVIVHARVHDARIPARWHDFQHDPLLPTYQLVDGSPTAHLRRLPWIEFAFDLADPEQLAALPDDHPDKWIAPGEWSGEALWRIAFTLPVDDRSHAFLVWRLCAVDAAGNKACTTPAAVALANNPVENCGDGVVQPWEACDDAVDRLCQGCQLTCGDGVCFPPEDAGNCLSDCGDACDDDGTCEPGETADCCDCSNCGTCGDGMCQKGQETSLSCPEDCRCGDGICEGESETSVDCPEDCQCGDGVCDPSEPGGACPEDCDTGPVCGDGVCDWNESPLDCPQDCSICGDCICQGPENPENCWVDCGHAGGECGEPTGGSWCGDGICDADETPEACLQDCGPCGDGFCHEFEENTCPDDCRDGGGVDPDTDSDAGGAVDDGLACSCRDTSGPGGLGLALALLLMRRRSRVSM